MITAMETFTAEQVNNLRNAIFIRRNIKGVWTLLRNADGLLFDNIFEAIEHVRANANGDIIELAGLDQALLNNGEWDNL